VIGGGIAGAYVAYKSSLRHPEWKIALFERSARVGGRLLSIRLPPAHAVAAELGGMRYRTSQPLVTAVIDSLALDSRPFLTLHDDNRYLLRGRRWRAGEPSAATAYALDESEGGLSPAAVLIAAFERVVPNATQLGEEEWLDVKRNFIFRGRPLRDWHMGNVLRSVLSDEGYRYVVDGFGYATLLSDRNAADAIPWVLIEARPEEENRTLAVGMEALPRALAGRFAARGGEVSMRHHLLRVERTSSEDVRARYRLTFRGRPSRRARRVVLALPRQPLEDVALASPPLDHSTLGALMRAVTPSAAAKLFLAYERAWWRDLGLAGRRAVSDLALNKTYYFDPDPTDPNNSALLMASYSDGPSRAFWKSLSARADRDADVEAFDSPDRWRRYAASPTMLAEAGRQLCELHGIPSVPEPVASAFVDWGTEGFGGAWHVWNAGIRSWEVISRIAEPMPGEAMYVCGEAYSSSQGWVEGALESAERVLERLA
jgi:monoamine oxidase